MELATNIMIGHFALIMVLFWAFIVTAIVFLIKEHKENKTLNEKFKRKSSLALENTKTGDVGAKRVVVCDRCDSPISKDHHTNNGYCHEWCEGYY